MAETMHFRGEGGGVWEMSLPLPEHQEEKVRKGQLVRVNPDGSNYVAPVDDPPGSDRAPQPVTSKPAVNAGKDLWVSWAVHCGADRAEAEAMTKVALVDAYTPKDDQPPTQPTTQEPEGGDG